jgi:hypothetical protein
MHNYDLRYVSRCTMRTGRENVMSQKIEEPLENDWWHEEYMRLQTVAPRLEALVLEDEELLRSRELPPLKEAKGP